MIKKDWAYVCTIAVLAVLLSVSVSGNFFAENTSQAEPLEIEPNVYGESNEVTTQIDNGILSEIYEYADKSVVQITSKVSITNSNFIINGSPLEYQSTKLGSGFVFDSKGHIVTNNHVVEGIDTVDVTFSDGSVLSAKVIGADKQSDIAVLEITDRADVGFYPLEFADSSEVKVGDLALAIGNPFGLRNTMTSGIISYTGRLLPNPEIGFSIPDIIQTDAAINPGNSGGPLLNYEGKIIGMNTAIQSKNGEFSGIGFAIPSNTLKRIVPVLVNTGVYVHPWLGISGVSITPDIAEKLDIERNSKGVAVMDVVKDSAADKGGLKPALFDSKQNLRSADIITEFDGKEIHNMDELISSIESKKAGDEIVIGVLRDGKNIDISVKLQERPQDISK